jgi:hypothetical protein
VLEKTTEQIAAEKKAQRDAARESASAAAAPPAPARTAAAAPASTPAQPAAPGPASHVAWIVSMMVQALYVVTVFLSGSSPLIWLLTGGVFIGNFLRRKTGWGNFIAAVVVSSALAALVHGMKN